MFEEFSRELRRLGLDQGVEIPIELPLDEKGYLDRECPHRECGAEFKVIFDDWRDKVPDHAAFCPKCGVQDDPTNFNTESQERYIQEVGEAYVADELNRAFGRAARRTRPRRISAGLLDVSMSVSYQPSRAAPVVAAESAEALRQDFTCESCKCHYSTIGAGYFCPACGHNSAIRDFDSTVKTTLSAVDSMEEIREVVAAKHDEDVAANIEQQMFEDQIENLVTALQRSTEALFRELPNAGSFAWDTNRFQRLQDASDLWKQATGRGYDSYLSPGELAQIEALVQRRHKLGHCQGMVDQRYIEKSGDASYAVGQRFVTTGAQVRLLAGIVTKLVHALRDLVAGLT